MNIKKIKKFILMNRFEKHRSWVRNTYSLMHRLQFRSIGKKSYFLNPMFISGMKYIAMGEDVGIWDGARLEMIDSWENQVFSPELIIGDHVNIGQDFHLTCADRIVIENNVLISARVSVLGINHITDDKQVPILKQGIVAQPIIIKEGAFLGINSVIMPGVTIGKYAIVGANSVVTKDIPDYSTVVGAPAREIRR